MGKSYKLLQKKVERLESQLHPILSTPPDPETAPLHQPVTDVVSQELLFLKKLISAEKASAPAQTHAQARLRRIGSRVRLLQTSLRDWAEARPVPACVEDDDVEVEVEEEEEGSSVAGFTVYDNPEFVSDDDYDDEEEVESRVRVEECGTVKQEEEEEEGRGFVLAKSEEEEGEEFIESQSEEEEEEEEDEGTRENCYGIRVVFGVTMIVMGVTFMLVDFPNFADHHSSALLLVPT